MAKSVPKTANIGVFLQFLGPYRHQNFTKTFLSCRGGSKHQFGGSYVNWLQE